MSWLIHYGIPLRSGRYPAGSGKNPRAIPRFVTKNVAVAAEGKNVDVRSTKKQVKELKKQEKLHKKAGRIDWHHGNFASRKLHRKEAKGIKEKRQELKRLLDLGEGFQENKKEYEKMTSTQKKERDKKDAESFAFADVERRLREVDSKPDFDIDVSKIKSNKNLTRLTDKQLVDDMANIRKAHTINKEFIDNDPYDALFEGASPSKEDFKKYDEAVKTQKLLEQRYDEYMTAYVNRTQNKIKSRRGY